jgi:hypothetical protein
VDSADGEFGCTKPQVRQGGLVCASAAKRSNVVGPIGHCASVPPLVPHYRFVGRLDGPAMSRRCIGSRDSTAGHAAMRVSALRAWVPRLASTKQRLAFLNVMGRSQKNKAPHCGASLRPLGLSPRSPPRPLGLSPRSPPRPLGFISSVADWDKPQNLRLRNSKI